MPVVVRGVPTEMMPAHTQPALIGPGFEKGTHPYPNSAVDVQFAPLHFSAWGSSLTHKSRPEPVSKPHRAHVRWLSTDTASPVRTMPLRFGTT